MADLESEVTPPVAPPAEPTPPAAPPAQPEEPEAVEVGGTKMVPITALHAEREKSKALKDKAQRYDEVAGWVQAVRPEIEYLQQHPEARRGGQAPAPAGPVAPDPKHVALAQKLDLYTREGLPDVARAAEVMSIIEETSQSIAQRELQPMRQQTARERAVANFQTVSQLKTADGHPINQEALRTIWNNTPAEMLQDPQIAYVYAAAVLGHERLQAPAAPAPNAPPLITEAAGNRQTPFDRQPPTDLQQRVMAVRGIDSKRYAELTRDFKPGVSNTLED